MLHIIKFYLFLKTFNYFSNSFMQDLTKCYKMLYLIYATRRKEEKIFVCINTQNIKNILPLIEQPEEMFNLEYSLDFKVLQNILLTDIKNYLYYKTNINVILKIKNTNKKLEFYKQNLNKNTNEIQNRLNNNLTKLINLYIKNNLVLQSYLSDLMILNNKKDLNRIELEEIEKIKKKVHNIIVNKY